MPDSSGVFTREVNTWGMSRGDIRVAQFPRIDKFIVNFNETFQKFICVAYECFGLASLLKAGIVLHHKFFLTYEHSSCSFAL
jgi:hypothetical protein